MRPQLGGDALTPAVKPPSRKSSVDHAVAPWSNVPTTFVMKRADEVEQPMTPPQAASSTARYQDGTYGVQSLADTLEAAFGPESTVPAKEPVKASKTGNHSARSSGSVSHTSSTNSVPQLDKFQADAARKLKRGYSAHGSSTPLKLPGAEIPSPHPLSALSSTPRSASITSLKLSDEEFAMDDVASQAVSSGGEDEESVEIEQAPSSFPQLVMPVMQMPTRRPFTTRGKAMGKLKVMVAGETGLGKSSLIRSIVQACEDIVHVDPLSPSPLIAQSRPPKSRSRTRKAGHAGTTRVTETHASTKPYPHWWADIEESRVLRRRKSGTDTVLERNICFVDTPGYCHGPTEQDDMNLVVDYVESLLFQTSSVTTLEDNDALGVVSGSGGVLVDIVIYLLPPNKDITKDIDYMQRLSYLTNVIPVIAKSDTLSAQEVVALKTSILARLQTTALRPFFFGEAMDDALLAVQGLPVVGISASGASSEAASYPYTTPTYPYAVSSTSGPDNDNMDASLLMSPDYVQPLLPSELGALVHKVFDPESIAWLRHSAAKKFLAWRRRTRLPGDSVIMQGITHPRSPTMASVGLNGATMNTSLASSVFSAASPSGVLVPGSGSPFYPSNLQSPLLSSASLANSEALEPPGSFSLAKYNKSMQGDQRFSEIRIARWATDLQRSRRNEKDRFEELQSNERAKWLLERVGEEVSRGTIVACPDGTPRAEWAVVRHGDEKGSKVGQRYAKAVGLDSRDPLGLCDFSDEIRRRSFVLVKVLGGMSVVGAVVVAVIRACGIETGSPQNWWAWITGTD
ncbi:CDC3 Septin family protein [Pyrenophora tritici-repentis]|uniref:Septin n=1 Tax=Pyrenophora tritici-repentis TaxID=45151 RepID=A0A2W1F8V2_9PLEO|nr:CDC3 Septin family protein [Pyrenophora tritici-repentis]KAF7444579.1 CDC3 Septin family protein [Pyrenophora tritici-repentis]KAF7564762.1 CDC3, Septin family protein [Pyrenophora tritici-repentis]KAG9378826.1 CDC3 Septin family protein [Pyrenophora tritici-repentis]KAI0578444.1 CDC3 Septin family protein [Pyrenophora tritici-repentis]